MTTKVKLALVLALVGCGGYEARPAVPGPAAPPPDVTTPGAGAAAPTAAAPDADAPTTSQAPAVPIAEAVRAYVTESQSAWASKDPKRFSALYAPGAVVGTIGAKGWDEATVADMDKQRAAYLASFPDLELTYTRVVARGAYAVAEWVLTGTNKGDTAGPDGVVRKATNKKIGFRGATVVTFAPDGKVRRESNYFDMGTMMGQLGLGPKGQPVRPAEKKPSTPVEIAIGADGDKDDAARAWLTAAMKGASEITALASEDVVVSNQYMPTDTKGKKALTKELTEGLKAFTDQKSAIVMCVPAAQVIACEYTWTATWTGKAMGMSPTNKTGTVHSLEVLTFKDGKVAATHAYANGAEFATAFGVGEEPAKK